MTNALIDYGLMDNKDEDVEDMDEEGEEEGEEYDKEEVFIHEHEITDNGVLSKLYTDVDDLNYLDDRIYFMAIEKNNKIFYKRMFKEDEVDTKIKSVKKPFMQVEYKDDENSIEIQNDISCYYLEGNKILDYNFVRFLMKENYGLDVKEEYKIIILDENVKMLTLEKDEYVLVIDDEDENYKICKN